MKELKYKEKIKEQFKIWWIDDRNEIKKEKKWWKQIPNFLSSVRLIIAPILPILMLCNIEIGVLFIIIGASTDCLDGLAARKLNAYSKFGEKLDTLADKMFSLSSIISISCLIGVDILKTSLFSIKSLLLISLISNIVNEFIIGKINVDAFLKNKKTKSSMLGKIKTWPLFLTIIFAFTSTFHEFLTPFLNNLSLNQLSSFIQSSSMLYTTIALSITTFILQTVTASEYKKQYEKEDILKNNVISFEEGKKNIEEKQISDYSIELKEKEMTKQKVLSLKQNKRF